MKNLIISSLLVYIFASVPGWAVAGSEKLTLCLVLDIIIALLLTEVEELIIGGIKCLRRKHD